MQRKIGYGLIGASLTLFFLLGAGFVWQSVMLATAVEPVEPPAPLVSLPQYTPPTVAKSELGEQDAPSSVSEPVLPTPMPTTAEVEPLLVVEPEPTPFILPNETDDPIVILASLQFLADHEQEKWSDQQEGWYHQQTMSWWPQANGIFRGQTNEQEEMAIPSSTLLGQSSIHDTYLRYTADKLFVEGIALTRHAETGEIQQISVLSNEEWINVSLRNLGFGEDMYRVPARDFSTYFPVQQILEGHTSLWQQMNEQVTMYAYMEKEQYIVHLTQKFAEPIQAAGASGLHQAVEYVVYFDIPSGYFVSDVTGLLVEGGREKMASHTLLSQAFLTALPEDIQQIYQQNTSEK